MLNTKTLRKYIQAPIDDFRGLGDVLDTPHGPMIFQDNGADVLAVAHLDVVDRTRPKMKDGVVRCPQLDDRLGAWVLLDVLPKMGIKCNILLTDSEEIGQSTAQYFAEDTRYNWAFSFDRSGTDAVLYEYETPELVNLLGDYGIPVGWGSFSDICSLNLGVSAINFGVGYHNQHTRQCYADLRDTQQAVDKFARFYQDNKNTRFDHVDDYVDDRFDWSNEDITEGYTSCEWDHLATQYGYQDVDTFRDIWQEYQNNC